VSAEPSRSTPVPWARKARSVEATSSISLVRVIDLRAYETPIDKMLSLPSQRATLELVPDQGAEPRPDGP
jgi:hypothetical protein